MTFRHKLSRRLALLRATMLAVSVTVGACKDDPIGALPGEEPSFALSSAAAIGSRVAPSRWVEVRSAATSQSNVIGAQGPEARGYLMEGPVNDVSGDGRARWRVNFDQGADGWVVAMYLDLLAPPATTALPASIMLAPDTTNIVPGMAIQLNAVVRDGSGNPIPAPAIAWSSSRPHVATVSGSGLVTGVTVGGAAIFASSGGFVDSTRVWVNAGGGSTPAVAAVTLTPPTATVTVNGTVQLTAVARDGSGTTISGASMAWSTSNSGIATVSTSGLVRGVAAGTAGILATSGSRADTTLLTVTPAAPVPIATVSVSPLSPSIQVGGTVQLTASARDALGNLLTGRPVTWTTSNNGVATVSGLGLVTGVAPGSATLTATSEGRSGTSAITVTSPPPPPPPADPSPGMLFASDFSSGLGASILILTDSNRWNATGGAIHDRGFEVIRSTGLDFPSANVLRHTAIASASGYGRLVVNTLGDLAVGASRGYRVYVRATMPDAVTDRWHPIEDVPATRAFRLVTSGPGRWTLDFRVANGNVWTLQTPLQKGVTYRVEWLVTRLSGTTMSFDARVYNTAGALLFSSDGFRGTSGTLATVRSLPLDSPASMRAFAGGSNGIDSPGLFPFIAMYQGAFAICSSWCGPYRVGEARR